MRCSAASMTKSPASRSPAPRPRNARRATGPPDRILQRKQAVKSARMEEWESHPALASPDLPRNPDARQAWRTRSSASGNSLSSCLCATTGRGWTGHRRSSPKRCSSWPSRRLTGCRGGQRRYSLLRRIEMGVYNRMTVLVTESYVGGRPSAVRARVGAGRAGSAFQRRGAIGQGQGSWLISACSSPPAPAGRDSRSGRAVQAINPA